MRKKKAKDAVEYPNKELWEEVDMSKEQEKEVEEIEEGDEVGNASEVKGKVLYTLVFRVDQSCPVVVTTSNSKKEIRTLLRGLDNPEVIWFGRGREIPLKRRVVHDF